MSPLTALASIVLVHGGFVDGSGWEDVYRLLKKQGFEVSVVQLPSTSLATDVTITQHAIAAQAAPVILVGHSYGGTVITEAGNDPKVAGLVYVAAFAPDSGESVGSLIKDPPPGADVVPILPPQDGFFYLDRQRFAASFAGDVDKAKAEFMANSQTPWSAEALKGTITVPAWKSKPSWYLVTTRDRMIPLAAQQFMASRAGSVVSEVAASHAVFLSRPKDVAELIEKAARAVQDGKTR